MRFPIAVDEQYRARVDERDHVAVAASLRPFFAPRSRRRRRRLAASRLDRRRALPQHPRSRFRRRRLSGQPRRRAGRRRARLRSIAEIPDAVDLAVICVPGAGCSRRPRRRSRGRPRALRDLRGFAEVGAEGAERQEQLLCLVRAHGARLVGPNCLGIAVPRLGLNATFAPRALPPGPIAFSSQSGALGLALLEKAAERGSASRPSSRSATRPTSPRTTCSSGGRTTRRPTSCSSTSSPSGTRRSSRASPAGRAAQADARAQGRDIRAGARAASSHTAALAGSDAAVETLFRRRAFCVPEPRGARRRAALLSSQPLPRAAASPCSRTPAGSASSAPMPATRRASSCRSSSARLERRSPPCCRARRASRTPSTCSGRRPQRRTRRCCPRCCAIRVRCR